ncbi:hypothetical protein DMH18_21505 [Streptomyces sp. WAC 06783]|uniref:hypothetical protein n=1 Tax=Streptomyces sp. WAC 06783 TaxID=2203211 RepID=UPI000F7495B4|nr:hypothetical protein [Streptomyces sp. WAC 06783]RSO08096.1 hypothetical protein DMH18_21505 [Streptomyces sp. WAC 06783]
MPTQPTQLGADATAFIGVLTVGVVLIMNRSIDAEGMSVLASALGGLYTVWTGRSSCNHK